MTSKSDPDTPTPTNAWERFRAATRQVLSVSKEELAKREAAWRKKRAEKRKRAS
jgi:hypothetical protein